MSIMPQMCREGRLKVAPSDVRHWLQLRVTRWHPMRKKDTAFHHKEEEMARGKHPNEAQRALLPQSQPSAPSGRFAQPPSMEMKSSIDAYATSVHTIAIAHAAANGYGTTETTSSMQSILQRPKAHSLSGSHDEQEKLSAWQTTFHLISFMAGSGLACLPLALVETDWFGLVLLILAAIVSAYTAKLLIEALDIVRWSNGTHVSYSDLGYECFGRMGQYLTGILVHASFLISSTGYLGIATACIAGITGLQNGTVLVLLSACVWLHVFCKSLTQLAFFSAVNVALAFWIEAVIFGDAMYPLKQITLDTNAFVLVTPDLTTAPAYLKLAYSFSLLSSGFFCHAIIPTFYNAMDNDRQCATVVTRNQMGVMATVYLPICIITYAVYGATLQAPVFFNMRNAFVRNLTIVLYTIHLLLSYTITLHPMQQMFENCLLRTPCGAIPGRWRMNQQQTPSQTPVLSSPLPPLPSDGSSSQHLEFLIKLVCRTVLVLVTLFLAFFFSPSTLDVFAYMIVPTTMLSMVLPCIFYWILCRQEASCGDKCAVVVVLVLAIVTMVFSFIVVICSKWQLRYWALRFLSASSASSIVFIIMASAVHYFTPEYPDKDYKVTTDSQHPQTKYWPAYLPVNDDRLFIFERSKNAQLVVYTANYKDKQQRLLDPKWPLDINWQSYGWTANPTCNPTGMVERKMAWGYSHKAIEKLSAASYGSCFQISLNALSSRPAFLYSDAKGRIVLQTTIANQPSRLWKVYVCTNNSTAFIPKVLYVELYGMSIENNQDTYERINVAA